MRWTNLQEKDADVRLCASKQQHKKLLEKQKNKMNHTKVEPAS